MSRFIKRMTGLALLGLIVAWFLSSPTYVDPETYDGLTGDVTAGAQVFYTGGSENLYSGGALLIPMVQRDYKMTYTDLRFTRGRYMNQEVNVGYGRRRILGEGILGRYFSYDHRRTSNRNDFNQFTFRK